MTMIAFPRLQAFEGWSATEHETLRAVCEIARGDRTWETGLTESGDPQFYLLGPLPEQVCELCVSRIGGRYVLEDGAGRLLVAHRNLEVVAMHARDASRRPQSWLVARIVLMWCTVRHAIHERIEPVIADSEVLANFAPQLAMLA